MRRWSRVAVATTAAWILGTTQAFGATTYTWQQINQMGKMNAHNGRLLAGCHTYWMTYTVHPPAGQVWELDIYISGPGGKQVASTAAMQGADPLSGTKGYKLCTATTPKGAFMLTGVMNLWGPAGHQYAHIPVVHYWLT